MSHVDHFPMLYDPFEEVNENEPVRCCACGRAVKLDRSYYQVGNKVFCLRCEAEAEDEILALTKEQFIVELT